MFFFSIFSLLVCLVTAHEHQQHRDLHKRTTYTSKYTSIVAFGASYQDSGHAREDQYKQYQRGWPYASGRFTDGPVAVEYVRSSLKVPILDYAYGGSVVVNDNVVSAGTPSVADQVTQYLANIKANSSNRGKGRVMHLYWAGINDVIQIWTAWRSNGDKNALANVKAHAERLIVEARRVQSGAAKGITNADIMILPLPPLEVVPNILAQSSKASDLAFMKKLVSAYNSSLKSGITALQKSGGTRSRVITYDVTAWWYNTLKKPSSIGVTNVKDACYNSSTGAVCKNPTQYFYFDTLHPTTSTFKSLSKSIFKAI